MTTVEPLPEDGAALAVGGTSVVQVLPVEEPITRQPGRPLKALLQDIEWFASWDSTDGERRLQEVLEEARESYPESADEIELRKQRGMEARKLLQPFFKLGSRPGDHTDEANSALEQVTSLRPDLVGRAQKLLEKGLKAKERYQQGGQRRKEGKPLSTVRPQAADHRTTAMPTLNPATVKIASCKTQELHPNDIRGLAPSPQWTVLIDETGDLFDDRSASVGSNSKHLGRFVALLIPKENSGLRELRPGWHAVDQGNLDELDRVVQAVLDARVGILGVTVQQVPERLGERWVDGVLTLLDLILRLLPLQGETRIEVAVENRGVFSPRTSWEALGEQARWRLAQAYPDRARLLEGLSIRIITKEGSPYNGYVDAIAFTWSGAAPASKERLRRSALDGTCLLSGDAKALGRAWEWLDRGTTLSASDWARLISHPEAAAPGSLSQTVLERLGQACSTNTLLWRRYLDETAAHLDSRGTDLRVLGRQMAWLQAWCPRDEKLPPPMRLLWLTVGLARANHMGHTEQAWMGEMQRIGDHLLEENAPLVCRADLNLAVNATNRYDFELASRSLQRWRELPAAVPGLRYWAQVRSSLGQHAAFQGNLNDAVQRFDEALAGFARLSDPGHAQRESAQTAAYKAITLMDDQAAEDAAVRAAVEEVTGPLPDNLTRLASSGTDADKYPHHLLLRWLVHRGDDNLVPAYVGQRDSWEVGEGHPWPLIQLYRALLLHPTDPDGARALAVEAFSLATGQGQGPVVQLIGACARAIAAAWGEDWTDSEVVLDRIAEDLPLASHRVGAVRGFLEQCGDPVELLRAVLPFNFR